MAADLENKWTDQSAMLAHNNHVLDRVIKDRVIKNRVIKE
jgi:hypothetical protein